MRRLRSLAVAAALVYLVPAALANPLSDGWKCAKNAGVTAAKVGADTYKKAEAVAAAGPKLAACLDTVGTQGQALAITSSALTALRLAKPSLLPKGQCESRIKGVATKPFAYAIAALAPAGAAKEKLLTALSSETGTEIVWDQISQLPMPVSLVPDQIHCGCVIADTGASLSDISEITNQIATTSKSCAKFLDSVGLGIVNDIGGATIKTIKSVAGAVINKYDEMDESDPGAPEQIYAFFFGDHVGEWASMMAKSPGNNKWQSAKISHDTGACSSQGDYSHCHKTIAEIWNDCVAYYDDHKMSKGNAQSTCNTFRDAAVAAASATAARWVGLAKVPPLLKTQVFNWQESDWLWRLPMFRDKNGYLMSWTSAGNMVRAEWSDVWGDAFPNQNTPWTYNATGVYAAAKTLTPELGNNAERAVALAYAGALEPLRDKVADKWRKHRKENGKYQLAGWYPKQPFDEDYTCPNSLRLACTTAMEAQYDKTCIDRMIKHFTTVQPGKLMAIKFAPVANACRAELDPILANAKTLADAEQAVTGPTLANQCALLRTRDEKSACAAKASVTYRGCAEQALAAGLNDASACFAKNWGKNKLIVDGVPGLAPKPPRVDTPMMPNGPPLPPASMGPSTAPQPSAPPATPMQAVQKSTLCRFTAGPRAGQTQDYAPMAPIPVGSNCHDARGSTGVVVAPGS